VVAVEPLDAGRKKRAAEEEGKRVAQEMTKNRGPLHRHLSIASIGGEKREMEASSRYIKDAKKEREGSQESPPTTSNLIGYSWLTSNWTKTKGGR